MVTWKRHVSIRIGKRWDGRMSQDKKKRRKDTGVCCFLLGGSKKSYYLFLTIDSIKCGCSSTAQYSKYSSSTMAVVAERLQGFVSKRVKAAWIRIFALWAIQISRDLAVQ